ncbi:MAG: hypothetical protein Q4C03_01875, partial [bacterium]|nr:hypothetical protein [bacterium]
MKHNPKTECSRLWKLADRHGLRAGAVAACDFFGWNRENPFRLAAAVVDAAQLRFRTDPKQADAITLEAWDGFSKEYVRFHEARMASLEAMSELELGPFDVVGYENRDAPSISDVRVKLRCSVCGHQALAPYDYCARVGYAPKC